MTTPRRWADCDNARLADVVGVCFDLDDTFTTDGQVRPAAFDALWRARDAGLFTVVVTGRPAGWCDFFARMWPVDGVVGENGGLYYAYRPAERRVVRVYARTEAERRAGAAALAAIEAEALRSVPGCAISADQPFRMCDLAVDFAEDVGPLPRAEVRRIADIFRAHGATAKISSIHVNGWIGDYDKRGMLLRFAAEELGLAAAEAQARLVYVGDSPNDSPLFGAFDLSVGVANVLDFADDLDPAPAYVTDAAEGAGFVEVIDRLLVARDG